MFYLRCPANRILKEFSGWWWRIGQKCLRNWKLRKSFGNLVGRLSSSCQSSSDLNWWRFGSCLFQCIVNCLETPRILQMKSSIVALMLIGLVAAASAEVFFREEFESTLCPCGSAGRILTNFVHLLCTFMCSMLSIGAQKPRIHVYFADSPTNVRFFTFNPQMACPTGSLLTGRMPRELLVSLSSPPVSSSRTLTKTKVRF